MKKTGKVLLPQMLSSANLILMIVSLSLSDCACLCLTLTFCLCVSLSVPVHLSLRGTIAPSWPSHRTQSICCYNKIAVNHVLWSFSAVQGLNIRQQILYLYFEFSFGVIIYTHVATWYVYKLYKYNSYRYRWWSFVNDCINNIYVNKQQIL